MSRACLGPVVTRFAPSPTGELHLGHVANAVWTWGTARALRGTVLLRIEDHDRGRSRREYEAGILADLDWLGLAADPASRASLAGGGPSPWRQSDCDVEYRRALEPLAAAGLVYGCSCTRSQIARSMDMGQVPAGAEVRYPGTCRDRGLPLDAPGIGLRVRLPDVPVRFDDLRLGVRRQQPQAQCGDLLARDAAGNWTYQFAVAVDDLRHGVTLVVRGEDLLESTGRQVLLGELLGRADPARFLHHPLIRNPGGVKLNKKDRALSLRAMRDAGVSAAQVLAEAARASAWEEGAIAPGGGGAPAPAQVPGSRAGSP